MTTRLPRPDAADVGRAGERIAASFLRSRGVRVLANNVRSGKGEVDLLVEVAGKLVAVEVKTTVGPRTRPEENFHEAKASRLRETVSGLIPRPDRVDLVAVVLEKGGASVRWLRGVL